MWALPSIVSMNEAAGRDRRRLERAAGTGILNGKKIPCNHGDETCEGELRTYLVYDIFSDDPKEVPALCERHDGYYGSPAEGYFTCDGCQRVMVENYTHEMYYHIEDGSILCLKCYCEEQLDKPENWIELTPERIAAVDFNEFRKSKHLLAVQMPVPQSIEFQGNVELDGSSGGRLTGFSSCESTPDGGVQEVREILTRLMGEGHKRAILILDSCLAVFSLNRSLHRRHH